MRCCAFSLVSSGVFWCFNSGCRDWFEPCYCSALGQRVFCGYSSLGLVFWSIFVALVYFIFWLDLTYQLSWLAVLWLRVSNWSEKYFVGTSDELCCPSFENFSLFGYLKALVYVLYHWCCWAGTCCVSEAAMWTVWKCSMLVLMVLSLCCLYNVCVVLSSPSESFESCFVIECHWVTGGVLAGVSELDL